MSAATVTFNRTILKWWKCAGITPTLATRKKQSGDKHCISRTVWICPWMTLLQIIMKYCSWSIVAYKVKVVFKQGLHGQACNGYISFPFSCCFICWFCLGWLWSVSEWTWVVLICWHYCPVQLELVGKSFLKPL